MNGLTNPLVKDIEDVVERVVDQQEKMSIVANLQKNRTLYDSCISGPEKAYEYRGYLLQIFQNLKNIVVRMLDLIGTNDKVLLQLVINFMDFKLFPVSTNFMNVSKTVEVVIRDETQNYERKTMNLSMKTKQLCQLT